MRKQVYHTLLLSIIASFSLLNIAWAVNSEQCPVICMQKHTKVIAITSTKYPGSSKKAVEVLSKATPDTDIHIYLRDGGGSWYEGEKIIKAMKKSKGRSIVEVIKSAKSMGALIMLNANLILTKPSTSIVFHLPRNTHGICSLSSTNTILKECAQQLIAKYGKSLHQVLSNVQWKRFMNGEDVYLSGDTLVTRLAKAKLLPRSRHLRR